MYDDVQVLLTLFLYLAFFGWVGWRRGTIREGAVLLIALLSWWVLQSRGDIFVRIANFAAKIMSALRAGVTNRDLGSAVEAVGQTADVITPDATNVFVFGIWVGLVALVYFLTNRFIGGGNGDDGWSIILGMVNGLVFGAILLPRLLAPLVPGIDTSELISNIGILDLFSGSVDILADGLDSLWVLIEPQSAIVILMLITLLLVIAATSLRGRGGGGGGGGDD